MALLLNMFASPKKLRRAFVDFDAQMLVIHTVGQSPVILRGSDVLTVGEMLPCFSTTIADLFTPMPQ
jgi:hypothetical protein